MKKLLILGANNSQVQLIKAAKAEDYYVIACDYTNDNPGLPLVDKHYQVSYLEQEAVLAIAKEEQIDGVIGNTDPAMPVVANIAEQLGLVGNKPESINYFLSKSTFRQFQEQIGLYCPKHTESDNFSTIELAITDFDYPIIVKPSLSAATQGTTKISSDDQTELLHEAFDKCKAFSRDGKVTIEEYVEMPSLEIIEGDIFVMGAEMLWNGLFTTRRSVMSSMIPQTYIIPAILSQDELSIIKTNVSKVIKEAGVRHGEYNVEMYFTKERELFIIEINPRQGGHRITQQLKKHTGIDYNKLLVTTAVGDNDYYNSIKDIQPQNNFLTHHVVFSDLSGVLEKIEIDPRVINYVTEIEYHKEIGQKVHQRVNATDYIAYVGLQFPDRKTQLAYSRDKIEQLIYPVVKDREIAIVDSCLPYKLIYDFMTGDAYDFFVPKLAKAHRTAEDYARQFSSYCTIAYDMDEKNQLTGMVAGYTHNLRIPQWSYIAEAYVNREHRGRGLGEKLMTRYIDYCKSIGMKGVWLYVREHNDSAQRLYQKLGFVFVGSSNEDGLLRMDLSLTD